jgi:hypothetical protein
MTVTSYTVALFQLMLSDMMENENELKGIAREVATTNEIIQKHFSIKSIGWKMSCE